MTAEDYCKIIETAGNCGVSELKIDKFSLKFHNNRSIEVKDETPEPMEVYSDIPNHQEIETDKYEKDENDLLLKAEELDIMMIEDPQRFEELLANDPELIKRFERELEEE